MRGSPHRPRGSRGFVLLAIIVVMAIALAVTMGMLLVVRGETAAAATLEETAQSRALAWSAVQAVGSELDRQRDRILEGEAPTLDRQLVLYERGAILGVARLLPQGGEEALLVAEGGKLDLNGIDAEALALTGLLDAQQAAQVVARRGALQGRFGSELDLLGVPGLAAETVVGPLERLVEAASATSGAEDERGRGAGVAAAARGLLDVVTVHAVEPALQRSGARRIVLDREWSETLGERIAERFGAEAAQAVQGLIAADALGSPAAIVKAMRARALPVAAWGEVLDAFATEPGEFVVGRLDLNTAPYEALLGLPGIGSAEAAEIVRLRDGLAADERAFPTWPLLRGIVDEEAFEALAGRVTTRTWCWRVRIAAGEVPADDPEGPIRSPVVWEAVIDLTTAGWRLGYLRDLSLVPLAAAVAAGAAAEEPVDERGIERAPRIEPPSPAEQGDGTSAGGGDGAGDEPATPLPKDEQGDEDGDEDGGGDAAESGAPPSPSPPVAPTPPAPVGRWRVG